MFFNQKCVTPRQVFVLYVISCFAELSKCFYSHLPAGTKAKAEPEINNPVTSEKAKAYLHLPKYPLRKSSLSLPNTLGLPFLIYSFLHTTLLSACTTSRPVLITFLNVTSNVLHFSRSGWGHQLRLGQGRDTQPPATPGPWFHQPHEICFAWGGGLTFAHF